MSTHLVGWTSTGPDREDPSSHLELQESGHQIGAHALAFPPLPLVFDSAHTVKIFKEHPSVPFCFLLVSVSGPLPLLPPLLASNSTSKRLILFVLFEKMGCYDSAQKRCKGKIGEVFMTDNSSFRT